MMEAFAFENSCAFLSTVQTSVPQLIFNPHTLCPLAKDWIQGQCFNLTCIISYFHLVLGGPWWF